MIKGTKLFKVTIEGEGVDPKPFNQYEDWKNAIENNTFADAINYKNKAKANYRWMLISMALNKGLETLSNIKAEATSSSIPGSVEFVLTYTQPDALWIKEDENVFEGANAITKIIEDTLNQTYNVILTWFDPAKVNEENESSMAKGTTMSELEVEAVTPTVTVKEQFEYTQFSE